MPNGVKAYRAYDEESCEPGCTIVFAEDRGKAKVAAMASDCCENAEYIDIRVRREPKADKLYKGAREIDWYDDETRLELVKNQGWKCLETSWECKTCVAKEFCSQWEDKDT